MSLEEHRAKLAVLEEHCQSVGRDMSEIEVTHNTRVVIAETAVEFDKLITRLARNAQVSATDYRASLASAIVGTPDQCFEQLKPYVAAGISYFFLIFPDPTPSETLELFAREVMPRFSATGQ
jgi:alkanesulfonate monooxygenase SsuD/methylene tetrahydromethanopterin reductase-like flavin-dependent oxidoreductase (luciferase family)